MQADILLLSILPTGANVLVRFSDAENLRVLPARQHPVFLIKKEKNVMKKKITALVMAAAMCLSVAACGSSDNGGSGDTAKDTYTVGICQLVQHQALDAATQGFKDALKEELGDKVEFVEQNAANDIPT